MTIDINAAFDGGNIRMVRQDGDTIDLEIVRDHQSDFYQWFYFRAAGARDKTITFRIVNCAGSAYPFGWPGYRTRVSADRTTWRMAPDTRYDGGVLSWTHRFAGDVAWFAYFAPYTIEQHDALIARIAERPGVTYRQLGTSLDGRAIDCLTVGNGAKPVWLYARQHPGESMAEWWMEGALEKLTDPTDTAMQALLADATIHVVPNMNPDGSFRGHLRTNAAGVNLNREWNSPTVERSPEVLCVRNAMDDSGMVFAIDVHGDEAIPANFMAGFEGIPSLTETQGANYREYLRRLEAATPDFQTEKGYDTSAPGKANLSMSTNQLAERFGAVSMTLEMPFKDHDANPDPEFGWSPERSKRLAHACLDTLAGMIDQL